MKDKHTLMALREGFLGRAVYKLKDIDKKFNLIKEGSKVLDLGCYPGSWVQYLLTLNCDVYGIDLRDVKGLKFRFMKKDFDVIVSDLSPKITGIKELDYERSIDLCYRALFIAKKVLKSNGNFLVKIFDSPGLKKYISDVSKSFRYVKVYKPKASKKRSNETYVIAKSKHNL